MNPHLAFIFVAIVLPFSDAYGSAGGYGGGNGGGGAGGGGAYGIDGGLGGGVGGVEDLLNAAGRQQQQHGSITAAGDVGAGPSAQAGLAQANAQLQALNGNSNYRSLKNSETIAEGLAENSLASNMRNGNIDVVAPNVVGQTAFRSLLVPNGANNHLVTATQPLQPIVVNQPGAPPAQISSGPPAVVRAAPIVYKLKPSIIYQQEVINKIPTPLSLNPVYVKVYKPGQQVDAPVAHHSHHSHGGGYGSGSSGGGYIGGNDGGLGGSQYGGVAGGQSGY